jgi:site-specific recombinase XerD
VVEQSALTPGGEPDQVFQACQVSPTLAAEEQQEALPAGDSSLTIKQAIQAYLQHQRRAKRRPKTLEWHRTALGQFQQYLLTERHLVHINQITEADIRGWFAFLHEMPSATGKRRVARTIETYARSVRAFCNWLVHRGDLACSPVSEGSFPRVSVPLPHLIPPETFEQLVRAGAPPEAKAPTAQSMVARNRALLWVLFETGISVSEVCALRLFDVDRKTGILSVRGKGGNVRQMTLGSTCLGHLLSYLKQSYPTNKDHVAERRTGDDPLFLFEQGRALTKNAVTLLFGRLRQRAGVCDTAISPQILRHSFALRYLQAGGEPRGLQELLGYAGMAQVKQYLRWHDQFVHDRTRGVAHLTEM